MNNKPRRTSPAPLATGLVEIFTGDGKGKTSAALGIALRALGYGIRVCVIYFMKGDYPCSEQKVLSSLPNIDIIRFGGKRFVNPNKIGKNDIEQARKALKAAQKAITNGKYDVIILDEVNIATAWNLLPTDDVIKLVKEKPENVELILTGRSADSRLVELADVVTEMKEIKHPYKQGILAREGIDY